MRVTPRSRRSRAPFIWFMLMITGSLLCFAVYGLGDSALRGFEQDAGAVTSAELKERINILLLGIDQRAGMSGPARTDTMLVLTIDPQTRMAGLFSINRDLWVTLPDGQGEGKINTAHFMGEARHLPGGGPALAQKTVEAVFNLPVPYYVRFNFSGFEKLIDLIGGIDVEVPAPIDDPDYPDAGWGYEPFHIDAGWQHLDGHTALRYARTRATPGSDFDRVKRQQQVILAVRDKVLNQNLLPQLLPQTGALLQTLGDTVQTNLTPRQIAQLAEFAGQIDRTKIITLTIEPTQIEPRQIEGQAALLLKPGAAQQLHDRLYGLAATRAPTARAVVTAPTTMPALSPATPALYTVQAGDTLFDVAQRYGITVEVLLRANHLTDDTIYAGQQLVIPPHDTQER